MPERDGEEEEEEEELIHLTRRVRNCGDWLESKAQKRKQREIPVLPFVKKTERVFR